MGGDTDHNKYNNVPGQSWNADLQVHNCMFLKELIENFKSRKCHNLQVNFSSIEGTIKVCAQEQWLRT
mgnify:CR=1 FL=1